MELTFSVLQDILSLPVILKGATLVCYSYQPEVVFDKLSMIKQSKQNKLTTLTLRG